MRSIIRIASRLMPLLPILVAQETRLGTIELTVLDGFGELQTSYAATLEALDGSVVRQTTAAVKRIEDIQFGAYRIVVMNGCCRTDRPITLNQPKMWVRLGIPIRFGDAEVPGGFLAIKGSVSPSSGSTSLWLNVRGLFLEDHRTVPVSPNGKFTVGGLDPGIYLLELLSGPKVLHWRQVVVDLNKHETEIRIALPR